MVRVANVVVVASVASVDRGGGVSVARKIVKGLEEWFGYLWRAGVAWL